MKTEKNFTTISDWDISSLRDLCIETSLETWMKWNYRQATYQTHVGLYSIPFIWSIDNGIHSHAWNSKEIADLRLCVDAVKGSPLAIAVFDAVAELKKHREGVVQKLVLARLMPGENIPPHIDSGPALQKPSRCHLPIISPSECIFTVGGESRNLKAGTWIEINNTLTHSVINNSEHYRVHLMCDILPTADWEANKAPLIY